MFDIWYLIVDFAYDMPYNIYNIAKLIIMKKKM